MTNRNAFILIVLGVMTSPVVYAFQLGTFEIKPIAFFQEKFDDNIRLSNVNKKSDWISVLSVGLEGRRETKVDKFEFKGRIEQKVFAKENDLNGLEQHLDLAYKRELTQYDRLNFTNKYIHGDESATFEDEFGKVSGRFDYYKNFSTLNYEHDFTQQLTGKIRYSNEFYNAAAKSSSDSVLNRPGMELAYAFSSRTIGSIMYDYANRVFDPGGTVTIHTTQVGIRRFLSNQISVDVKAGVNRIHTIDDQKTTRPNFLIGVNSEIDETTRAGITFTKTHDVSYSSSDLFNNWNISLFWGKQLMQRLQLNLGVFTGAGQFASGIKEKFNGVNLALDYEIKENVKANIGYKFSRRDTTTAGRDYDKNTVYTGITIEF